MSKKSERKRNITGSVWYLVLLLVLLVIATAVLTGSFIKRYTTYEKNVIAIMADANAAKNQYDDPNLPAGAVPGVETGGLEAKWETETSVDLFKTTYTDADGNVTVESSNGDKIIAPGTTNYYIFVIKNTGNISLDYTLLLEGIFKISDHQLPFYVRLRRNEAWIVGDKDHWVHVDQLGDVVKNHTLPRGDSDVYVFEWQWPYEVDEESDKLIGDLNDTLIAADANDTKLGDIALAVNTDFRLNITTTTVVTPGASPTYRDGTLVRTELIFICLMIFLILLCIIFFILLLLKRRKNREDKAEQNTQPPAGESMG